MLPTSKTIYLERSSITFRSAVAPVQYQQSETNPWIWLGTHASTPTDTLVIPYDPEWRGKLERMLVRKGIAGNKHLVMVLPANISLNSVHEAAVLGFRQMPAAGGLVMNPQGELLLIHRRGVWDLPKGKVDPGESLLDAAVRETEEETGITGISQVIPAQDTTHIYLLKGKVVMKDTAWFRMTAPMQALSPQAEEDIDLAVWANQEMAFASAQDTFPMVADLIRWNFI